MIVFVDEIFDQKIIEIEKISEMNIEKTSLEFLIQVL